jgi:hypothetical protein
LQTKSPLKPRISGGQQSAGCLNRLLELIEPAELDRLRTVGKPD